MEVSGEKVKHTKWGNVGKYFSSAVQMSLSLHLWVTKLIQYAEDTVIFQHYGWSWMPHQEQYLRGLTGCDRMRFHSLSFSMTSVKMCWIPHSPLCRNPWWQLKLTMRSSWPTSYRLQSHSVRYWWGFLVSLCICCLRACLHNQPINVFFLLFICKCRHISKFDSTFGICKCLCLLRCPSTSCSPEIITSPNCSRKSL